jgi:hypothetical protein
MQSKIDCIVSRTKRLLELDAFSVVYWDDKQEFATNPNVFVLPLCSLERLNELHNDLFKGKKHNIEDTLLLVLYWCT